MAGLAMLASYIFIFTVFGFSNAVDYCNIDSCRMYQKGAHTMCIYPTSNPAWTCGRVKSSGFTLQERTSMVNLHNSLRQKVASGQEHRGLRGPQPRAAYMPNLVWDNELATIAQRWANQCRYGMDECSDTQRFGVGQNVADISTRGPNPGFSAEELVMGWYDEVQYYDGSEVSAYKKGGKNIRGQRVGHYTQMVWADTTHIGCGKIVYEANGKNVLYLVCNYGPNGNVLGWPVYQRA